MRVYYNLFLLAILFSNGKKFLLKTFEEESTNDRNPYDFLSSDYELKRGETYIDNDSLLVDGLSQ